MLQESGAQRTVELSLDATKLPADLRALPSPAGYYGNLHHPGTFFAADQPTYKEIAKDPITDSFTFKEIAKDPIIDQLTTISEVTGPVITDPGPFQGQFGGLGATVGQMPFILATPHHAPAGALALQMGQYQNRFNYKNAIQDVLRTGVHLDHLPTNPAWDDTYKEVATDPLGEHHPI